jgi:hypothetical protein
VNDTAKCLLLIAFGALLGWGATTIWPFFPFQRSNKDWVDVATALGTCAAVVVALWIGLAQQAALRRDARNKAILVAAGLTPRMARLTDQIETAIAKILFRDQSGDSPKIFWLLLEGSTAVMPWRIPTEDLSALTPLAMRTAVQLGRGVAIVNLVATSISESKRWFFDEDEGNMRATLTDTWVSQLRDARALILEALVECHKAARDSALVDPTMREPTETL